MTSEIRTYDIMPLNCTEIARYAHCDYEQCASVIEECISEAAGVLSNRVCFRAYDLFFTEEEINLGFAKTSSLDLRKNLRNCDRVIVFAATVGVGIDRMIQKYNRLSPSKAFILQAVGTEAVETVCDRFCNELKEQYTLIRPRFSPGYGDLPLTLQKDIFSALSCEKQIGLTLNNSLIMSPSKSVTALVGIGNTTSNLNLK